MKNVTDVSIKELEQIRGGDWFETTWGVMLGAAFLGGLLGSGGFLGLAAFAGTGLVVIEDF